MPGSPMCEHRIQDDEQLAHARRQCHLLGFPGSTDPLIEGAKEEREVCYFSGSLRGLALGLEWQFVMSGFRS